MRNLFFMIIILLIAGNAFAVGEAFQIETTGTEYCDDFDFYKFNAKNNVNFWIYLLSPNEAIVSYTPDFQGDTFHVSFSCYAINAVKSACIGNYFDSERDVTFQSVTITDKYGTVKSIKGNYIQYGAIHSWCFSSGTFYSTKRLW